jgi:hypothetical protein
MNISIYNAMLVKHTLGRIFTLAYKQSFIVMPNFDIMAIYRKYPVLQENAMYIMTHTRKMWIFPLPDVFI